MIHKLFKYIFLSVLFAVFIVGMLVFALMYHVTDSRQQEELEYTLFAASQYIQKASDAHAYLDSLKSASRTIRYTWIAADGSVLYDTMVEAHDMENHNDRNEIIQARKTGSGKSHRFSSTLDERTTYLAFLIDDGSVLRMSRTSRSAWSHLVSLIRPFLLIIAVTLVFSSFLANRLAKKLIAPILSIDLEHPEDNDIYDELSPLLLRIIRQKHDIGIVMDSLQAQRRELEAVTDYMSEGLIILNMNSFVLLINRAALQIFGHDAGESIVRSRQFLHGGCHFLEINHSAELKQVIERAKDGFPAETMFSAHGRMYRISANPVIQENEMNGIVLLLIDITDKAFAEQMRREFTANVSHELKTPLTSISGYAELIRDGIVARNDVQKFAGKIVVESTRLMHLIDDIIKLSRLDEAVKSNSSDIIAHRALINLSTVAQSVVSLLEKKAKVHKITMTVCGVSPKILGVPVIIEEMIFNLCDNAVKYNIPSGTVTITVGVEKGYPFISTADTGIGIPEGEHEKVFERFYRVDKSRSKETGGTGLGLSIVKHAAQYHNAQISLTSTVGKGTEIKIIFPKPPDS